MRYAENNNNLTKEVSQVKITEYMRLTAQDILESCIKRDKRSGIKRKPGQWGYYKNPDQDNTDALWFWEDS